LKVFLGIIVIGYGNKLVNNISKTQKNLPTPSEAMNWTQKVGHIFKQLIRIELCIVQGAILLILF